MVKNLPANAGDTGDAVSVRFLGQEEPLEKEKAAHSSILAGIITWTEEPDGLQFFGAAEKLDMAEVMTERARTHRHTPEITWLLYSAFL